MSTLLNTPPKNLLKAFKEFIVFFVFYLSFGGSIEGGQSTPSKDEIALLNTPPRNIKARFFATLRMTDNYVQNDR